MSSGLTLVLDTALGFEVVCTYADDSLVRLPDGRQVFVPNQIVVRLLDNDTEVAEILAIGSCAASAA